LNALISLGMRNGICFLLLALPLASCGLVGRALYPKPSDPDAAQVKISKGANGARTANLELPGGSRGGSAGYAPQPGAAAGGGAASGGLFDFSSAFQNQSVNRLAHWRYSGMDAITEAKRTGMPLLMLFTNSGTGTKPAEIMDTAVSAAPDLTGDAPRFVPLRVDFYDKRVSDSAYYKALRDRYKVHGFPVLIVALPDGTELTRQSGCTEDWAKGVNRWMDDAAFRAKNGIDVHRKRLADQHYRLWKNGDGHEVFAHLESQDANKLVFTTEWGETIQTFTNRLSEADRKVIESKQF
jgi:hypothetical protein